MARRHGGALKAAKLEIALPRKCRRDPQLCGTPRHVFFRGRAHQVGVAFLEHREGEGEMLATAGRQGSSDQPPEAWRLVEVGDRAHSLSAGCDFAEMQLVGQDPNETESPDDSL